MPLLRTSLGWLGAQFGAECSSSDDDAAFFVRLQYIQYIFVYPIEISTTDSDAGVGSGPGIG